MIVEVAMAQALEGWRGVVGRETYRAYCITPFFPSCEGNGTSLLFFPVTLYIPGGGVPGLLGTLCCSTWVADLVAVEEIAAFSR